MPKRRRISRARFSQPPLGVANRLRRRRVAPLAGLPPTRRPAPPPSLAAHTLPRVLRPRRRLGARRRFGAHAPGARRRQPRGGGGGYGDGVDSRAVEADAFAFAAHVVRLGVAGIATAALSGDEAVSGAGVGDCGEICFCEELGDEELGV